jgi:hypothetical protein
MPRPSAELDDAFAANTVALVTLIDVVKAAGENGAFYGRRRSV